MDKSLWKTDDKTWMRNRREEWKKIKHSLDNQNAIKKKYYKYHKQLFLSGDLNPHVVNEDMTSSLPFLPGSPILYLLWYYPFADLVTFSDLIEEYKGEKYMGASAAQADLFILPVRGHATRDGYDPSYGMLGGREELIVQALFPSYDYNDVTTGYRDITIHKAPHPKDIFSYIDKSLGPLFDGYNAGSNIYAPGQYLWDHFDHGIDSVREELEARPVRFYRMLYLIKHWKSWEKFPHDDRVVAIVEKLKARFDNREFGDTLMRYWDDIDSLYATLSK